MFLLLSMFLFLCCTIVLWFAHRFWHWGQRIKPNVFVHVLVLSMCDYVSLMVFLLFLLCAFFFVLWMFKWLSYECPTIVICLSYDVILVSLLGFKFQCAPMTFICSLWFCRWFIHGIAHWAQRIEANKLRPRNRRPKARFLYEPTRILQKTCRNPLCFLCESIIVYVFVCPMLCFECVSMFSPWITNRFAHWGHRIEANELNTHRLPKGFL